MSRRKGFNKVNLNVLAYNPGRFSQFYVTSDDDFVEIMNEDDFMEYFNKSDSYIENHTTMIITCLMSISKLKFKVPKSKALIFSRMDGIDFRNSKYTSYLFTIDPDVLLDLLKNRMSNGLHQYLNRRKKNNNIYDFLDVELKNYLNDAIEILSIYNEYQPFNIDALNRFIKLGLSGLVLTCIKRYKIKMNINSVIGAILSLDPIMFDICLGNIEISEINQNYGVLLELASNNLCYYYIEKLCSHFSITILPNNTKFIEALKERRHRLSYKAIKETKETTLNFQVNIFLPVFVCLLYKLADLKLDDPSDLNETLILSATCETTIFKNSTHNSILNYDINYEIGNVLGGLEQFLKDGLCEVASTNMMNSSKNIAQYISSRKKILEPIKEYYFKHQGAIFDIEEKNIQLEIKTKTPHKKITKIKKDITQSQRQVFIPINNINAVLYDNKENISFDPSFQKLLIDPNHPYCKIYNKTFDDKVEQDGKTIYISDSHTKKTITLYITNSPKENYIMYRKLARTIHKNDFYHTFSFAIEANMHLINFRKEIRKLEMLSEKKYYIDGMIDNVPGTFEFVVLGSFCVHRFFRPQKE